MSPERAEIMSWYVSGMISFIVIALIGGVYFCLEDSARIKGWKRALLGLIPFAVILGLFLGLVFLFHYIIPWPEVSNG